MNTIDKIIKYLDSIISMDDDGSFYIMKEEYNDMEENIRKIALNGGLVNVSQQRKLLIKFLNEINYKELDKCNFLPNIPEVVDNYLNNSG